MGHRENELGLVRYVEKGERPLILQEYLVVADLYALGRQPGFKNCAELFFELIDCLFHIDAQRYRQRRIGRQRLQGKGVRCYRETYWLHESALQLLLAAEICELEAALLRCFLQILLLLVT